MSEKVEDEGMYYLYRHVRIDQNKVFYIGIGKKRKKTSLTKPSEYERAFSTHRNTFWKQIASITKYKIEIIMESNDIDFIKKKEIELIKLYGRYDLNQGFLCNLTDGGDGTFNRIYSKERNAKISEALRKRIRKPETLLKISKAKQKPIISFDQNGNEVKKFNSLSEAAKEVNVNISAISVSLKNSKKRKAGGFYWKFLY